MFIERKQKETSHAIHLKIDNDYTRATTIGLVISNRPLIARKQLCRKFSGNGEVSASNFSGLIKVRWIHK